MLISFHLLRRGGAFSAPHGGVVILSSVLDSPAAPPATTESCPSHSLSCRLPRPGQRLVALAIVVISLSPSLLIMMAPVKLQPFSFHSRHRSISCRSFEVIVFQSRRRRRSWSRSPRHGSRVVAFPSSSLLLLFRRLVALRFKVLMDVSISFISISFSLLRRRRGRGGRVRPILLRRAVSLRPCGVDFAGVPVLPPPACFSLCVSTLLGSARPLSFLLEAIPIFEPSKDHTDSNALNARLQACTHNDHRAHTSS